MTTLKTTVQEIEPALAQYVFDAGFTAVLTALGNIAGDFRTQSRDRRDYCEASDFAELRDKLWALADDTKKTMLDSIAMQA